MEENIQVTGARYQQIAADIASKIVEHQYEIGDRIYARSLLASQYAVSSETARKAIAILSDLGIVDTVKGSGVVIKSYENAVAFLRKFSNTGIISELRSDVITRLNKINQDGNELRAAVAKLVDHSDRFRSLNPLAPFSIYIEQGSTCVDKSIADLDFWQNTGATIVAIRRGDELIISPGPYAKLMANDTVYYIGEQDCVGRVSVLLQEIIA